MKPEMQHAGIVVMDSPIGKLRIVAGGSGLAAIQFAAEIGTRPDSEILRTAGDPDSADRSRAALAMARQAERQLQEYFAGKRQEFDLPLAPHGTAFQLEVWDELGKIPYGHTITYGQLARRLGNPTASRAVGAANGRNPLPIVVPCHRVIGSNGKLTGYAGGIDIKLKLLMLEGAILG